MQTESGSHGFSQTLEIKGLSDILDRTGSVKSVAAEAAQNSLTHTQEFHWGDVFMKFKYQNKGGKLLANGRPVETIGVGDRMDRVMAALDAMLKDSNIAESIVVSEDIGEGRHFLYKYTRDENGDIEGLAFEYQGKTEELSNVVGELGRRAINRDEIRNKSNNFSLPLFFTKESKNNVEDLARAANNSFRSGERRRDMKKYLDRLNRDTTQFDQLIQKRKMQEEELAKQFEKIILSNPDAKAGIAAAMYGAINMAKSMDQLEDRGREEVKVINAMAPDNIDTGKKLKVANESILPLLTYGMIAIPGLIDSSGRLIDHEKNRVFSVDRKDSKSQKVETILPIIPAVLGLTTIMVENVDLSLNTYQSFQDKQIGFNKDEGLKLNGLGETNLDVETVIVNSDEEFFWREFVTAIFEPVSKDNETRSGILLAVSEPADFSEVFVEFLPFFHADGMNKLLTEHGQPSSVENPAEQELLITSFQKGLEVVAGLVETYGDQQTASQPVEKNKQKILEDEMITLGKELLGVLTADAEIFRDIKDKNLKSQVDIVGRIAFLLRVYEDPNSGELIKSFVAALIYKQIQQFKENRPDFNENIEVAEILKKFDKISPHTSFLDKRFNLLLSVLQNFYPATGSSYENLISELIFVICQMVKLTGIRDITVSKKQGLPSFERLRAADFLNMKNAFSQQYKNTKSKKCGIIFCLDGQIIYQRPRYLSQTVFV